MPDFTAPPMPETVEELVALDDAIERQKEALVEHYKVEKTAMNEAQVAIRERVMELRQRPPQEGDVTVTPERAANL